MPRFERRFYGALGAALLLSAAGCDSCSSNESLPAAPAPSASAPPPHPSGPRPFGSSRRKPALEVSDFRLEETPIEAQLARGTLGPLSPSRGRAHAQGAFEAPLIIDGNAKDDVRVGARFALQNSPRAFRRPLAYARLARALDVRSVPATLLRRTPVGDLDGLTKGHPDLAELLKTKAVVQNDGTIDTLLRALSTEACGSPWQAPAGRPLDVVAAPEIATWARAVASPSPVPGENTALLRAYVELVILDYLGANVLRREVWLCEDKNTLALLDNDTAFAAAPDAEAIAAVRKRVDPIARFPRALVEHLKAFDAAAARAVLAQGDFEDWLVSPRMIDEYADRRATVLSLVAARIEAQGEAPTLSL